LENPHQALDAYMSFATATARKISCSESSHNPCLRRTRSAYRICAQAAMTLCTCNVTDRLLVNVTPRILIFCTRWSSLPRTSSTQRTLRPGRSNSTLYAPHIRSLAISPHRASSPAWNVSCISMQCDKSDLHLRVTRNNSVWVYIANYLWTTSISYCTDSVQVNTCLRSPQFDGFLDSIWNLNTRGGASSSQLIAHYIIW